MLFFSLFEGCLVLSTAVQYAGDVSCPNTCCAKGIAKGGSESNCTGQQASGGDNLSLTLVPQIVKNLVSIMLQFIRKVN